VLLALAAVGLAFAALLFFTQREMIYFPRRYAPEEASRLPPRWEAIPFESRGARQYLYWAPGPASSDGPVYFVFSGNATLALDWSEAVHQVQSRHPGSSFALVEYPGYGQSGGYPTRDSIARVALEAREVLRRRLGLDEAAFGPRAHVIGHSLGAAAALDFSARTGPRSILLLAPFTSLLDMARRVVGWPLCLLLRDRFDNRARLREIAARPDRPSLHIHHGDVDNVIPVQMGRALAREFSGWAEYHEHPGQSHNEFIVNLAALLDEAPAPPRAAAAGSGIR
jgi:pimeloyl-ACP methyl ester carboxylesterase